MHCANGTVSADSGDAGYANNADSFVNAWLLAAAAAAPQSTGLQVPIWPEWTLPEGPVRSLLKPPPPAIWHPRSGCRPSPICYPCLTFLKTMLQEQAEWGAFGSNSSTVIVELGSFLGEATVGLAMALRATQLEASLISVDTWHEHVGHTGLFQHAVTFLPPTGAEQAITAHPEWLEPGRSLLFEQFVRNVNASGAGVRELVRPVILHSAGAAARATELGATGRRPTLVYINPPWRSERLQHDLIQAWRLLACGGTLFGAGYHLFPDEIDAFAARLSSHGEGPAQPELETHAVHAPGAIKYENVSVPYSDETMLAQGRSNFSTWSIRPKRCAAATVAGKLPS